MTKKWLLYLLALLFIFAFTACDTGTSTAPEETPSEEETTNETTTVPPPENLMGTIALGNGKSAVMDIQFDDIAAGRSTTVSVSGKIRYEGTDYIVGGLYDYSTGALDLFAKDSSSGQKFVFSGTYTESSGFQGSIKLVDANDSEITSGAVSAIPVSDADKSTVKMTTGTFGGDSSGVWNGTLTSTKFYGTYCVYGDNEGGSFTMNRSGDSISLNTSTTSPTGTGQIDGDTLSGRWRYDGETGSWSGITVDSSYDAPSYSSVSNTSYLMNTIFQAMENTYTIASANHEDGSAQPAGISGFTRNNPDAGSQQDIFDIDGFVEPRTGIKLRGQMRVVGYLNGDLLLEMDRTDANNQSDDGGFEVDFEADGTYDAEFYTDAFWVDSENNFDSGRTNTWQYNGNSVLSAVAQFF